MLIWPLNSDLMIWASLMVFNPRMVLIESVGLREEYLHFNSDAAWISPTMSPTLVYVTLLGYVPLPCGQSPCQGHSIGKSNTLYLELRFQWRWVLRLIRYYGNPAYTRLRSFVLCQSTRQGYYPQDRFQCYSSYITCLHSWEFRLDTFILYPSWGHSSSHFNRSLHYLHVCIDRSDPPSILKYIIPDLLPPPVLFCIHPPSQALVSRPT